MKNNEIMVEEFTTPNPFYVETTSTLPEIWDLMKKEGIRHVLVKNQDQVVGIVSERDVTTFSQSNNLSNIQAHEIMSRDLITVRPDTPIYQVALKMSEEKVGSAIVQDSQDDFIGIFTATDALNALVEVLRGDLNS